MLSCKPHARASSRPSTACLQKHLSASRTAAVHLGLVQINCTRAPLSFMCRGRLISPLSSTATAGAGSLQPPTFAYSALLSTRFMPPPPCPRMKFWLWYTPTYVLHRCYVTAVTCFMQLRSMDQLLRCDDMRVADVVAALPLGRGRKENLLSQIKKWRQDPLAAIAFLSSAASAPLAPSSMVTLLCITPSLNSAHLPEPLHHLAPFSFQSNSRRTTSIAADKHLVIC